MDDMSGFGHVIEIGSAASVPFLISIIKLLLSCPFRVEANA